jgi:uncharacterized protein (TIGR03437 family)
LDSSGNVATSLAGTTIYFDGIPAPIVATSQQQVNVIVPNQTAGQPTTTIQAVYNGTASSLVSIPVTETSPGVFTLNASGTGPGAMINQDGTINSASNPAARGSVISVFANGGGISNVQLANGQLVGLDLPSPLLTVEAFIANEASSVLYAGGSPGEITGLLQVNVKVPSDIQPGAQVPIQLRIGGVFSQPGVTAAIR